MHADQKRNATFATSRESARIFLRTGFFGMGVGLGMPLVFRHSSLAMAGPIRSTARRKRILKESSWLWR